MQARPESPAVAVAVAFVRAIERGGEALSLVTPDVVEEEMPNRVFSAGATRDLSAMKTGIERGKTLFREQAYDIRQAFGDERVAAVELEWKGELAVPVGSLPAGATMRARAAFFFELRDGRIARIRHYDCFDPF